MTDDAADEAKAVERSPDHLLVIELSDTNRFYCLMFGLSSAGFAGVALWRGSEGAATVAFVALGALLMFLAISGVIPRRLKSGGYEMEFMRNRAAQETKETTDAALATMTQAEMQEFREELLRLKNQDASGHRIVAVTRAQEALDFERNTLGFFQNQMAIEVQNRGDGSDADYAILVGMQQVLIEIKWRATRAALDQAIEMANMHPEYLVWIVAGSIADRDAVSIMSKMRHPSVHNLTQRIIVSQADPPTLDRVLHWISRGRQGQPPPGVLALVT